MKLVAAAVIALTLLSIYHSQIGDAFTTNTKVSLEMAQESNLELYKQWKAQYKNSNSDEIDYYRYYVWLENLKVVQNFVSDSFTISMNQFADMPNDEFMSLYLGAFSKVASDSEDLTVSIPQGDSNVNVNWTSQGKVGPVLNQGQCGSCWSFSAAESLTSYTLIKNNTLIQYSEQQLVDCSSNTKYGNQGCNGGVVQWAYDYVIANGIESSTAYPYKGVQRTCAASSSQTTYKPLTSYIEIGQGNCTQLADAIQVQPISIAIDASGIAFQLYSSGIYKNCKTNLNHAILLTGYNSGSDGYWIAENSWGAGWGQAGYIQFALGNTCGLCNQATYPQ